MKCVIQESSTSKISLLMIWFMQCCNVRLNTQYYFTRTNKRKALSLQEVELDG